ncbi:hypothetical protein EKD16_19570 [Streptomonospora litoralis]|uniref:Uncharacterized protein n=1 Tax=Streptomonospora litoralis TaxID=2498135 RepID=A0A4P6Q9D0_9ACTN|nr:hypothetical protein EKD16_19570 [Streptomonospora litoralis]
MLKAEESPRDPPAAAAEGLTAPSRTASRTPVDHEPTRTHAGSAARVG